jgi:hypothetical protein
MYKMVCQYMYVHISSILQPDNLKNKHYVIAEHVSRPFSPNANMVRMYCVINVMQKPEDFDDC